MITCTDPAVVESWDMLIFMALEGGEPWKKWISDPGEVVLWSIQERDTMITAHGEEGLFIMKQDPVGDEKWSMDPGAGETFSLGHAAEGISLDLVGDVVPFTVLVEDVTWKMDLEEAGARS